MVKSGKTAIITFISQSRKSEERIYTVDDEGIEVTGIYTNDAPIKYLIDKATREENTVDRIICIVSEKVYAEHREKLMGNRDDSAISLFCDMVENYMGSADKVSFCEIPYDYRYIEDNTNDMKNISLESITTPIKDQKVKASGVYNGIISSLAGYENVYIDYTGGLRDISFLTTVLIRYLEFINISCRDIVYSNYEEAKIYSLSYIYDMFRLHNAVSQFVETGNGSLLKKVYSLETKKLPKEISNVVNVIDKFSKSIQLCDIKNVEEVINELNAAIEALEKMYANPMEELDMQTLLFRELLALIKEKFYLNREDGKYGFTYPKLIKWCLDNGFVQQALTLYIEKMPKEYYGYFIMDNDVDEDAKKANKKRKEQSVEAEYFYTKLYENIADMLIEEVRIINEVVTVLEECKDVQESLKETYKNLMGKSSCIKVKQTLAKIWDFIEKHYTGNNYNKKKDTAKDWVLIGKELNTKTATGCLNVIKVDKKLLKALVEGIHYTDVKLVGTYGAKVEVLQMLESVKDISLIVREEANIDLIKLMKYYLAMKYLRNNINHASENESDEDEKILLEYFAKQSISLDISYDNVHNIISEGLRLTHYKLF